MTEIRKLLGSIKKKARLKTLLTKGLLQKIAVYSFFLWTASLIGFFTLGAVATNFFSDTAFDTPFVRSDTYQILIIGTIVVGVFAFVSMVLFGVLGAIVKGKGMRLGDKKLPLGLTNKRLLFATLFLTWSFALFLYGRGSGLENAFKIAGERERELERQLVAERQKPTPTPSPAPLVRPQARIQPTTPKYKQTAWGGPELFEAINKRRIENGVNPLAKLDALCPVASRRLGEYIGEQEQIRKGQDAHRGFYALREDPNWWVFSKYTISEFLVAGYSTPEETVNAWEHTLGHSKLLKGGEWVWGCVYAHNTFAVAITAF